MHEFHISFVFHFYILGLTSLRAIENETHMKTSILNTVHHLHTHTIQKVTSLLTFCITKPDVSHHCLPAQSKSHEIMWSRCKCSESHHIHPTFIAFQHAQVAMFDDPSNVTDWGDSFYHSNSSGPNGTQIVVSPKYGTPLRLVCPSENSKVRIRPQNWGSIHASLRHQSLQSALG